VLRIVAFTFILLTLYFLHKLYNHTYSNRKEVLKPIIFFIGSFIASFLSHQLAFFLSFGYAFYIILSFINTKYINKTQVTKWNKYSIPFIPAILLFTVITLPFFGNLVRPIISYFLPQNIVNWVIPDWDHLSKLWASKPYFSWDLYVNVLKNDLSLLYYFGIVGFILTLIKKENRASGIFIISFFVPILLLMSFIFREPVLPRYLIGIYPLFVIAIAFCFDFILQFITQITKKSELSTWLLIPFTVVLALMSPLQRSIDLINSKQHGQVVPKALSHWHFTNWKEPATKIRKNIKDNDVVMTTNINATKFYLDISENLHWFRQMKYDGSLRRYVHRKDPNASKGSGYSLEGVKNLVNNNNRGWLLADYYFDNVMTDPKVRQYIIQNLDYHYEYGNESIKVFSWDKSRPKKYNNSILEELGRNPNKFQSKLYNLNVTDPKQVSHLIIEAEGLDYSNELSVIINKKKSFLVNPNTGSIYRSTKDHLSRQFFQVKIDNTLLKPGSNSVIFQYNKKLKKEKMKGCVVFNTQLR